ncbi:MAG TPA: riboflavin synthase [Solirubrobacteraceae bacterium]|nr:riboflavin synthase [Solirubrobacteraceae bacterium]
MFTGLVADLGRIIDVEPTGEGVILRVASRLAGEMAAGDSVAVNGVCLTATAVAGGAFSADVMNETLARSSLAEVRPGAAVNLELALRVADRLGGHIVQGHVDAVGRIAEVAADGFARRMTIEAAPEVLRYVVHKGSITVDGVSLTVAGLDDRSFTVSLIPETLERTGLGEAEPGALVNLEVDVLAKYVERLMPGGTAR